MIWEQTCPGMRQCEELATGGTRGPGQPPKRRWGLGRLRDLFARVWVSVQEAMERVRIWGQLQDNLCLSPVTGWIYALYVCKGVCAAAGVGLHPWGLICSGASKWGDWDPWAASGQTEYLSSAAGGIHIACIYVFPTNRSSA